MMLCPSESKTQEALSVSAGPFVPQPQPGEYGCADPLIPEENKRPMEQRSPSQDASANPSLAQLTSADLDPFLLDKGLWI